MRKAQSKSVQDFLHVGCRKKELLTGLTALVLATAPARASDPILTGPAQQLSEVGIEYDNDIGQNVGYMILTWNNTSPNIQDNNQITAETGFGSDSGLYDIDPLDSSFVFDELTTKNITYNINPDSSTVNFNGLFNAPENTLKFKYQFDTTNWVAQAESYLADPTQDLGNFDKLKMSYITALAEGDSAGHLDFNQVEVVCPTSPPITNLNISASTLSWPSVSNTTYTIESNVDLLTDTWNNYTNLTASGTNTVLDIETTNNVMYFRGREE